MHFRRLAVYVLTAIVLMAPMSARAQRATVTGLPDLDLLAAVEVAAAELVAAQQSAGLGLVEGVDYSFVAAGSTAPVPATDSVIMTRAALDRVLNELATLRARTAAQADALGAANELIVTRDELLGAITEKTAGERWYIRALQVGGGLVAGYLAGQNSNDTVVLR